MPQLQSLVTFVDKYLKEEKLNSKHILIILKLHIKLQTELNQQASPIKLVFNTQIIATSTKSKLVFILQNSKKKISNHV